MHQLPLGPEFESEKPAESTAPLVTSEFLGRIYSDVMQSEGSDLEWALEHIYELKSKEHIPLLQRIIERAVSPRAVFSAARALAWTDDLGSLPFLLLALDRLWDTHEPVHRILSKVWGLIHAHKPETWSYVLAQLDSPNEARQYNAAILVEALAGQNDYWILVDILRSQRPPAVRRWMVQHLGAFIVEPAVESAVCEAFQDSDDEIRATAAYTLIKNVADEKLRQDIVHAAMNDSSPLVHKSVDTALDERRRPP